MTLASFKEREELCCPHVPYLQQFVVLFGRKLRPFPFSGSFHFSLTPYVERCNRPNAYRRCTAARVR